MTEPLGGAKSVLSFERQMESHFICQSAALRALAWSFAQQSDGRAPRSVLFYGPSGTGKTFAAHAVARSLQLPVFQPISTLSTRWFLEPMLEENRRALRDEHSGDLWLQIESEMFNGREDEWVRGAEALRKDLFSGMPAADRRRILAVTLCVGSAVQQAHVGAPLARGELAEALAWFTEYHPPVRRFLASFDLFVPFFRLQLSDQLNATVDLIERKCLETGVRATLSCRVREWLKGRLGTLFQVEERAEELLGKVRDGMDRLPRHSGVPTDIFIDLDSESGSPAVYQITETVRLNRNEF